MKALSLNTIGYLNYIRDYYMDKTHTGRISHQITDYEMFSSPLDSCG